MSAVADIRRELAKWNCPNRELKIKLGISAGKAMVAGLMLDTDVRDWSWPNNMPLRFHGALVAPTDAFPGFVVERV